MSKKTYWEKLRDPRWQKMRSEVMRRDEFKCRECGDDSSTLNVHHLYYCSHREPWEYPLFSLLTLCECCHDWLKEKVEIHRVEGTKPFEEWEHELGFALNGDTRNVGDFWYVSVSIARLVDAGMPIKDVYRLIENTLTAALESME